MHGKEKMKDQGAKGMNGGEGGGRGLNNVCSMVHVTMCMKGMGLGGGGFDWRRIKVENVYAKFVPMSFQM